MSQGIQLSKDGRGQLVLKRAGQEDAKDVRVRRAFPWSGPRRFISIRNGEGKELELIDDLDGAEPELRRVLEDVAQGASWIETMPRRGYRYVGPPVATEDPRAEGGLAPSLALPEQSSIAVLSFAKRYEHRDGGRDAPAGGDD